MSLRHVSLGITLLTFSALTLAAKENPKEAIQPNILWVVTDDQRADSVPAFNKILLGQSDSKLGKVLSPNVDKLAAEGVTFINTFNQNPGCAPSRTSMHTGRYSHKTGVYGFEFYAPDGMDHWRPMFTQTLHNEAGYQTVSVGKQGLRYKDRATKVYETDLGYRDEFIPNKLFDWYKPKGNKPGNPGALYQFPDGQVLKWPSNPKKDPMDMVEIQKRLDLLHSYPKGADKKELTKNPIGGVNPQPKEKTRDAWYAAELGNYFAHPNQKYTAFTGIKTKGPDTTKPVFAYIGIEAPHTPTLPPEEFRAKFKNIEYKVPEFTDEELKSFQSMMQKFYKAERSSHYTDADKQQMIADYFALTAFADYVVGQAVDSFIEFSEKNKRPWLVLYVCGDHGWRLNDHGMISKFGPFDTDLHNPVIVVSSDKKAFPAGKVVKDLTQFVDIAPTFLAAAGIDISQAKYDYLDGQDLAQVVKHGSKRDYVIAEPTWVIGPMAVMRTQDYKFAMKIRPGHNPGSKNIDWAMKASLEEVEPMLFDLRADPKEVNNLAYDKRYRPIVDAMREKLQNVVLGDGRIEVKWDNKGLAKAQVVSNFAPGADDGKLKLPKIHEDQEYKKTIIKK